jgi:hypothetical protein
MSRVVMFASTALLLTSFGVMAQTNSMTSGRPSAVLNAEQCGQVWAKAVPSGDSLAEADAAPFIVNFKQADGDDQDGKISKSEFEAACAKGLVKFTDH